MLHDVFAVPHGEIGTILGATADATKMLTSRARRKVRAARQSASGRRQQREVVQAFLAAARDGRFEQLLQVLHPRSEVHAPRPERPVRHDRGHRGRHPRAWPAARHGDMRRPPTATAVSFPWTRTAPTR
ncbi:hypothetical protein GCM10010365_58040 [Streptomyces poonensis]|uniref:RNA polymerase sigma factor 70 region 4 type 2 domain-containing protein n=1 Tax=Streptomyces poonensis TaxID=68255 RepID=A0A918USE7_9ACTN|nr:hypothetical protein GCM10010365_58040 [Streptomyces poonensis]